MKLLIATLLVAAASAAPMQQSLSVHDDGSYQFFYETGKEGGQHSRTEVRHPDGVVVGKYSYEDANGAIREVSYRADDQGYVEGAPKAPSATPIEEKEDVQSPPPTPEPVDEQPEESAAVESTIDEEQSKNQEPEEPKDDLTLDDPVSADDPPETFPPGFFQKFHGLRRLPEPTKEDDPIEPSTEEPKAEEVKDNETGAEEEPPKEGEEAKAGAGQPLNEMDAFTHLKPFRSFAPQPMDTSMFRAPVYVFSYQHPDSYGYHYFF